uniref:Peptidase M60 domain-containing protein n=1 Tax=Castor canadensis TaxID=51338 RepID=A0A8C0W6V7_CASCN
METSLTSDFHTLMDGVKSWDLPKSLIPSELLLVGEDAFPVMVNDKDQVLIAASHYGQGRIVVASHEGYLFQTSASTFILNAVSWLCPTPGNPILIHPSMQSITSILRNSGINAEVKAEPGEPLGVYCISAYNEDLIEKLIQFVKKGGGLLIGGHGWYWAGQHGHDKVLSNFSGNQMISVAGVYITGIQGNRDQYNLSKLIPNLPLDVSCEDELKQDQKQLLEGISEMDLRSGGIPSQLLVHGELAFPVGLDSSSDCFLAAARYGRGRVVVAGHELVILNQRMQRLVLNALQWLTEKKKGKIGLDLKMRALGPLLSKNNLEWISTDRLTSDLSVFCSCFTLAQMNAKKVKEFVAEGGGLLIGRQAWLWGLKHPGSKCMIQFPENKILRCFGLGITDRGGKRGCFPIPKSEMLTYHLRKALAQLETLLLKEQGNLEQSWGEKMIKDCSYMFQILQDDIPIYLSVKRHILQMIKWEGLPPVSKESPVKKGSPQALLIALAQELVKSGTDSSLVLEHPTFLPPTESPITIEIHAENCNSWVSTGLYLPEGQTAKITLPDHAVAAKLKVLIGCHTDDISPAKTYFRPPVVTHTYQLDTVKKSFSWLWGGLLYIVVPPNFKLDGVHITISGASFAPYFKLGKTSQKEWKDSLLQNAAPWGELATDNIILTVPTTNLQSLGNPEPLLQLWDEMMQAIAGLSAEPFPLTRPERIVFDVQISAGFMHAGYPIMGHVPSLLHVLNAASIRAKGLWAPLHEVGHNHQKRGWEFPPHTTEAICSLWAIYVHETVLDIPRDRAHPSLKPETRKQRIQQHLAKGAPLREWSMWTALETYLQLYNFLMIPKALQFLHQSH